MSVITNVRNGAEKLPEAIESVLAQTFADWELIVWDNCSRDGSAEVARRYTDPRVRCVSSPAEIPLSHARAAAVAESRGEWVAFLDHDDIWLPDKLEKQMALAEDDPRVGIIYGRTVAFSEDGSERDFDHRHEFEPLPDGDIFKRLFVDSCFIAMSSVVIRRSAIRELGPVPDAIDIIPDYYYYTFLARKYRARAVQDVVCRYRVHGGGLTGTYFRRAHEEVLWILNALRSNLDPELFRHRVRVHQTLIAVEEMRHFETLRAGLERLVCDGSVPYLLSRPLARSYRAIRRRIQVPFWLNAQASAGAGTR